MAHYIAHVRVMPRASLLDPQGQAVEHALAALKFSGVRSVRIGRAIQLQVEAADRDAAAQEATRMCERLLANPVTEDFDVTVEELA